MSQMLIVGADHLRRSAKLRDLRRLALRVPFALASTTPVASLVKDSRLPFGLYGMSSRFMPEPSIRLSTFVKYPNVLLLPFHPIMYELMRSIVPLPM
jgi:hypothetical protein